MTSDFPNPFATDSTLERFSYLFENMETEMQLVYEADRAIDECKMRIAKHEETIAKFEQLYLEKDAELTPIQLELVRAQEAVKLLERRVADMRGLMRSFIKSKAHLKRLITVQHSKIRGRQKQLLLIEARKRLSSIGRTIKHNAGRRPGGGIDIVAIDAPSKKPFVSNKTKIQNEDPIQQEGGLLRPLGGEQPHQPQDPQSGGSLPPGEGSQA